MTGMNAAELAAEKAGRVEPKKKKPYVVLSAFLRKQRRVAAAIRCTKDGRMVDWSCFGGVGSFMFWVLAVAEWGVSYSLYFGTEMWQDTAHLSVASLVFWAASLWQIGSWYMTVSSDPGYVVDAERKLCKHHPAAMQILKDQYAEALENAPKTALPLDPTDGIVRPLRSKHCRVRVRPDRVPASLGA